MVRVVRCLPSNPVNVGTTANRQTSDKAQRTKPRATECEVLVGRTLWGFEWHEVGRHGYFATTARHDDRVLAHGAVLLPADDDRPADQSAQNAMILAHVASVEPLTAAADRPEKGVWDEDNADHSWRRPGISAGLENTDHDHGRLATAADKARRGCRLAGAILRGW